MKNLWTSFIVLLILSLGQYGNAQLGMFVEYDLEVTEEVSEVQGAILESRIGILLEITQGLHFRGGVSRLGKRRIDGGHYFKSFENEETGTRESLSFSHNALSSGYSVFGGIEIHKNKFLIGIDLHSATRKLNNGYISSLYRVSNSTTGSSSNGRYEFSTTYNSISYIKTNLKLGYSIYKRPRGGVALYLNFSYDSSDNALIKADFIDPNIELLNNSFPGEQFSGQSLNDFLTAGSIDYQKESFSVGMNVYYLFNVDVEKPERLKVGG